MTALDSTGLLVSVRSAEEAEAALAGGADIIDVKDPSRGSLGRADDTVIESVVRMVAGRRMVSAAMGDLTAHTQPLPVPKVAYVKWGLARYGRKPDWRWEVDWIAAHLDQNKAIFIDPAVVIYADWRQAEAPSPQEVWAAYRQNWGFPLPVSAMVLDTYTKDGRTLLDWMPLAQIALLCRLCRNDRLPIALAGSLGMKEIAALRPLQPTWFAVRGAACTGGRGGSVDTAKVRRLKNLVAEPLTAATSAG